MIRSIAHLLLILVVLACPVQCVIGGDSCCASKATVAESTSEQNCQSTDHCCHDVVVGRSGSNSSSEAPTPIPQSEDDCNCDCLCKGAISAATQIAEDCGTTLLDTVALGPAVSTDVSRHPGTPQADPPDALSGREIRTLRMSFQV